jgi:hypothetical protein
MGEPNPEQRLVAELLAVCQKRKPETREYRRHAGHLVGNVGTQGSQNWPPLGAAVAYLLDEPGMREEWTKFFPVAKACFMGSEFGFGTYCVWGHMCPVAVVHAHAVARGHEDVAAGALEWLRIFWGLVRVCTAPDDQVMTVGLRGSPWHDPMQISTWISWVRAFALGEDLGRWNSRGRQLGLGIGRSEIPVFAAFARESIASALSPGPLPEFSCLSPLHVLHADWGLAVWLDENHNSNTPPIAVATWIDGTIEFAPDTKKKIRRNDRISVRLEGETLVFESSLYPAQRIALPSAGVETVYGAGEVSEPEPVDPVDPTPSTDLGAIADLVVGLRVPNRKAALQRSLVAELRSGTHRPLNEIAADVEQLGIGPAQPQTKAWRTAIALLRGMT